MIAKQAYRADLPYMSVENAARKTGLSENTIRRGIKAGVIPSLRIGRRLFVNMMELSGGNIDFQLMSVSEAVRETGLSEYTIRKGIDSGLLPGRRIGRRVFVDGQRDQGGSMA